MAAVGLAVIASLAVWVGLRNAPVGCEGRVSKPGNGRQLRWARSRSVNEAGISNPDNGIRYGAMRDFLRGAVQLHILHHAAEGEIYGAWMSEELAEHGYRISPGTLYPTLHRLEEEGLLRSHDEVVEGRRRRMYAITPPGRKALKAARRALRELADEVLD